MTKKYPGFQYLISQDSVEVVSERHNQILATYQATDEDCRIERLQPATIPLDIEHGMKSEFELHWTTPKGWQVYMMHTGIIVSCPE